jgi:hypothetical protein
MTDTNPWRSAGAERTDWRDHAACSGLDTDLFFPVSTSGASRTDIEAARRICQCCPVMTPCLRWALDLGTNGSDARASPAVLRGADEAIRTVQRAISGSESSQHSCTCCYEP